MSVKKLLSITLAILIVIACFAGCAESGPTLTDKLVLKDIDEPASIHSALQTTFLTGGRDEALKTARGSDELSQPNGVNLSWENNLEGECEGYTLLVSENSDLSDAKTYETKRTVQNVINLKVATEYYWQVSAKIGEKTYQSEIKSFKTEDLAPRNLYVLGVTNARDLGGYKTSDGGRVKQGMLYRCGRLNDDSSGTVTVQDKGISVMLDDLKIKSEIDLRLEKGAKNHETSALGEKVSYFFIPMESDTFHIVEDNAGQVAKVFEVLGKEENYPIVFHCSIGTDRTGAIAFMVNALLGVEKEDLYNDYLFSNFARITNRRDPSAADKYYASISAAQGKDFAEKTYNYLLNLGVKKEDLDNTIRILKQK
ncbi:MAG: tyrosine-protein phosphatase [Clostridiales bacterium]|nr:tyrosine-protein phosphatase [Candidatus Equinaster intestinalis]